MRRPFALLTGLLAVLGFFFCAFSFSEKELFYFHSGKEDLSPVLSAFQNSQRPFMNIQFGALYGGRGQLQMLHPLLDVSQLQIEDVRLLCGGDNQRPRRETTEGAACTPTPRRSATDISVPVLTKNTELVRFFDEKLEVPEDFLTTPPFLNHRGQSYAYVLATAESSPYRTKSWVARHLSYFKTSELKEILNTYQIKDAVYSVIAGLTESEIEMTVRGEPLVLTPKYLLLKDQSRYGFSPLNYLVYELSSFEDTIKNGNYELIAASKNSYCLQRVGNACWTYNSRYALSYLYRYSVAILALLAVVLLGLVGVYLKRVHDKNREQQKHRLSLQVLSHEFRTPVSSLLLMMDQLTKNAQNFHAGDQDTLTRISTEVFRLQRIVEVSRTYLQAEGGALQFKTVQIDSINDWITDFIAESEQDIRFQPLPRDQSLKADPFWLKFILSNLVQNAYAHGAEPVTIRLVPSKSSLKIIIEDQGTCDFISLDQMTEPFVRGSRSKGMGLGLNIAKYIVDEWGGELQFSSHPTAFTLSFARGT